jgi:hypothetical protein
MGANTRKIEIAAETADLLETRAAARGISISDLVSELAAIEAALPHELQAMRREGKGPWSPDVLAEDARRFADFQRSREAVPWEEVRAWMQSWGTPDELPPPKPRKL